MQYLLPFVKEAKYNIPEACRLHPNNDIFREQELKKEHISTSQWQCSYCKKMFRSEKYLDQHLDNRHRALLNYVSTSNQVDIANTLFSSCIGINFLPCNLNYPLCTEFLENSSLQ